MTFLIVTHVVHKKLGETYYAYSPYVREMNIWLKNFDKVIIVAPVEHTTAINENESEYNHPQIKFISIPEIDICNFRAIIRTSIILPLIMHSIFHAMWQADHIHLRCPGNIGLIGSIMQIFFPAKKKTAKYAGNWDWNSQQTWSYRMQQRILRNTFLTKNMTALVYGEWPDKTKNIKPFFTASYSEKDKLPFKKKSFEYGINLAFVGGLFEYKSPMTSLEVLRAISEKGINARLTYCGDGSESINLHERAKEWNISGNVVFLGNVNSDRVKEVLQESHFLVFISRSEGWPKAVAEAMWWGCLPITTAVSCVPQMLGNGERGELVDENAQRIADIIENYIKNPSGYSLKTKKAMEWSRQFTLERFESEIKQLLIK